MLRKPTDIRLSDFLFFFLDKYSVFCCYNLSDILKNKALKLLELHRHLLGPLILLASCGVGLIKYVLLVNCVIFVSLGGHHQYSSLFLFLNKNGVKFTLMFEK